MNLQTEINKNQLDVTTKQGDIVTDQKEIAKQQLQLNRMQARIAERQEELAKNQLALQKAISYQHVEASLDIALSPPTTDDKFTRVGVFNNSPIPVRTVSVSAYIIGCNENYEVCRVLFETSSYPGFYMFKERLEPFGVIQNRLQPPFPRKIPLRKGESQSLLLANQFYAFQLRCFRETDMHQFEKVIIFSVGNEEAVTFRKMTDTDPLYKKIVSELASYSDEKSRYSLPHGPEDYFR